MELIYSHNRYDSVSLNNEETLKAFHELGKHLVWRDAQIEKCKKVSKAIVRICGWFFRVLLWVKGE